MEGFREDNKGKQPVKDIGKDIFVPVEASRTELRLGDRSMRAKYVVKEDPSYSMHLES